MLQCFDDGDRIIYIRTVTHNNIYTSLNQHHLILTPYASHLVPFTLAHSSQARKTRLISPSPLHISHTISQIPRTPFVLSSQSVVIIGIIFEAELGCEKSIVLRDVSLS